MKPKTKNAKQSKAQVYNTNRTIEATVAQLDRLADICRKNGSPLKSVTATWNKKGQRSSSFRHWN